jgi:hypothetical protein
VLCLVVSGYPVLYRVLGVVFGVLTAVVGVICLRNVFASAVLLMVFVGIGWIFDGMAEMAAALAGADDPLRRWRITAGVLYVAAAVVVLVWPALSLKTFLSVGAVALIVIGVAHVALTIGSARAARKSHDPRPRRRNAVSLEPVRAFRPIVEPVGGGQGPPDAAVVGAAADRVNDVAACGGVRLGGLGVP